MTPRRAYTPHGYQGLITNHILDNPRCAVWSFMGSGKTVSTLTALDILRLAFDDGPTLIVAPLRVAKNVWPKECDKWKHLRHYHVLPIMGTEAERRITLRHEAPAYSINFENVVWLIDYLGDRWPFKTIVWDESTRLSGFRLRQGTAQSRALAAVAHTKVEHFIELTGTPAPSGLAKLWGQLWFIDKGLRLGRSFEAFKQRWFQSGFDGYSVEAMPHAQAQIQSAIKDVCLSIRVEDWFPDLDKPIVRDVMIDLPFKARIAYRAMENDMYAELETHTVEVFAAAQRTQKLIQFASGAVYVDPAADTDEHPRSKEWREVHKEKMDALASIVEEMNGEPIIVAYEFRSDLARIMKAYPKAVLLDDKQSTEDKWNAGKIQMLLCHPKSAGHGLNLQDGGRTLVYFTCNWNLELHQQIAERVGPVRQHQSGHKRSCLVYRIIARGTIDEDVLDRLDNKRSIQDSLMAAMARRRLQ